MISGGHAYVEGPKLLERLKEGEKICFEYDGMEFLLKVSNAPKEKVDVGSWVRLYDADISILPLNDMCALYAGQFSLCIKDPKSQDLELNFSVDQIRVIKELFENYLTAFEANRRLEKEYPVKARAKSA